MCSIVSRPPAAAAPAKSTARSNRLAAVHSPLRASPAGVGNRANQIASTASPKTELTYCRTWQSSPVYEKKDTGALRAEMRDTIQPSACVKESHARCVHAPTRIESGASNQL